MIPLEMPDIRLQALPSKHKYRSTSCRWGESIYEMLGRKRRHVVALHPIEGSSANQEDQSGACLLPLELPSI